MFSLVGKITLVTGAASGIGEAIARQFAQAGALVYVADTNVEQATSVVEEIRVAGGQAEFIELDVTDEAACNQVVQSVLEENENRLDVLVNNAGVGLVGTILETSGADLERLLAVNVKGMFYLCKAALPAMIERKSGSIINLASIGGVLAIPDRFAYCATKFAVVGLTKCMALDHGETGVRINCICPGRVDTPFVQARLKEYPEPEKFMQQMVAPHALKRLAQPVEIANAALYLACDESAFVTGSSFVIDGGYSAGK